MLDLNIWWNLNRLRGLVRKAGQPLAFERSITNLCVRALKVLG